MTPYEQGQFFADLVIGGLVTSLGLFAILAVARTQDRALPDRRPDPANVPRECAMASWLLTLLAVAVGALLPHRPSVVAMFGGVLVLTGVATSVYALANVRRFGRPGLLIPALVGLFTNGSLILFAAWGFFRSYR